MKTSQNRFWLMFFKIVVPFQLKKHFADIKIKSNYNLSNKPVLLIANHSSWWDGWIAFYVSHFILCKSFHFMMLESELNKRKILYKIGGLAIKPKAKSVLASLRQVGRLLKIPNNIVLIYPQGKLFSHQTDHFEFQRGVDLLTRKILKDEEYELVMLYFTTEYFENKKPTAFIYLESLGDDKTLIEAKYQAFADKYIQLHKSMTV